MPLDIDALNRLDRSTFVEQLGEIFEHAPWVAERAHAAAPFVSVTALHDEMIAVVRSAPRDERLAFLNGHPELAGAEARAQQMTDDSTKEQGGAGLDRLSDGELAKFGQLNAAYRQKFGFPFIVAVRGRGKSEILASFAKRLESDGPSEEAVALEEIGHITRMRLDRL